MIIEYLQSIKQLCNNSGTPLFLKTFNSTTIFITQIGSPFTKLFSSVILMALDGK